MRDVRHLSSTSRWPTDVAVIPRRHRHQHRSGRGRRDGQGRPDLCKRITLCCSARPPRADPDDCRAAYPSTDGRTSISAAATGVRPAAHRKVRRRDPARDRGADHAILDAVKARWTAPPIWPATSSPRHRSDRWWGAAEGMGEAAPARTAPDPVRKPSDAVVLVAGKWCRQPTPCAILADRRDRGFPGIPECFVFDNREVLGHRLGPLGWCGPPSRGHRGGRSC